jgi:hypothetical protein
MESTDNAIHEASLDPYVKLAITYMGLMIAVVIISLVYYSVNFIYLSKESASPAATVYYIALIIAPGAAIAFLANRKKAGAYLVFAALAISLSIFVTLPASADLRWDVVATLLIPHSLVGILLLRALKTLA